MMKSVDTEDFAGKIPQLMQRLWVVSGHLCAALGAVRLYRGLEAELHRGALRGDPDIAPLETRRPAKVLPTGARAPAISHIDPRERHGWGNLPAGEWGKSLMLELLEAAGEWISLIAQLHRADINVAPEVEANELRGLLPRDAYGPLADVGVKMVIPELATELYWRDGRPPAVLAARVVAELTEFTVEQVQDRARYERKQEREATRRIVDPDGAVHSGACTCMRCAPERHPT